jgi:hypothetical protein
MTSDEIFYYVQQLTTANAENAYYMLLTHSTETDVPTLIHEYHKSTNPNIQANLLEVIWRQHPSVTPLEFIAEALQHPNAGVWQNAIDGIVAIGKQEGIKILEREEQRLLESAPKDASTRSELIVEAIQQLSETTSRS